MGAPTSYTVKLSDSQAALVKDYLDARGFKKQEVPYARFAGKSPEVVVVFYESGKLVVQGKGLQDFV